MCPRTRAHFVLVSSNVVRVARRPLFAALFCRQIRTTSSREVSLAEAAFAIEEVVLSLAYAPKGKVFVGEGVSETVRHTWPAKVVDSRADDTWVERRVHCFFFFYYLLLPVSVWSSLPVLYETEHLIFFLCSLRHATYCPCPVCVDEEGYKITTTE